MRCYMRMAVHFHQLRSCLSVLLYRFCAGDWTCDLLQDRALHTPVLLLLLGYSCLPAGHDSCGHAYLEHFTPPWWLPCTSSYHHQSLSGVTFPPTSRQWLRGVALLSHVTSQAMSIGSNRLHGQDCTLNYSCFSPAGASRKEHSCGFTVAGLTCTCNYKSLYFTTPPKINKSYYIELFLLLSAQKSQFWDFKINV